MAEEESDLYNRRKRAMDDIDGDDDLEDLVGQICAKLTDLKTTDRQQHIDAFIEVLECSLNEASFFLESAEWNISAAVSLFLEEQQYSKRRATEVMRSSIPSGPSFGQIGSPRFEAKPVAIAGLPEGWLASVSPRSGQIVFLHTATMSRQYMVPPGFASLQESVDMEASTTLHFDGNDSDNMPELVGVFDDNSVDGQGGSSDAAVDGRMHEGGGDGDGLDDASAHSEDMVDDL